MQAHQRRAQRARVQPLQQEAPHHEGHGALHVVPPRAAGGGAVTYLDIPRARSEPARSGGSAHVLLTDRLIVVTPLKHNHQYTRTTPNPLHPLRPLRPLRRFFANPYGVAPAPLLNSYDLKKRRNGRNGRNGSPHQ